MPSTHRTDDRELARHIIESGATPDDPGPRQFGRAVAAGERRTLNLDWPTKFAPKAVALAVEPDLGKIRKGAPAWNAKRLGSYHPATVGSRKVLCLKSELHMDQDGIEREDGRATLPVADLFRQMIAEAKPKLVITVGTAGGTFAV